MEVYATLAKSFKVEQYKSGVENVIKAIKFSDFEASEWYKIKKLLFKILTLNLNAYLFLRLIFLLFHFINLLLLD
mgnify:FL=1